MQHKITCPKSYGCLVIHPDGICPEVSKSCTCNIPTDLTKNFMQGSVSLLPSPNELSLCDEDIVNIYKGKSYISGQPIQAQLVKII